MSKRLETGLYRIDEQIPLVPVGTLGYFAFNPKKVCKVIENLDCVPCVNKQYYTRTLRVRWNNGKEEVVSAHSLSDFNALIEDHQKKLDTHLKMKKTMESL